MSLASIIFYMGVLAVAAAAPGPGVAAIVARVLGRGYAGAFAFTAGLAMGDVVWLSFSVVGLTVIARTFQEVFLAIRYAGAAYLLFLAWKLWTTPAAAAGTASAGGAESRLKLFLSGLSIALGNPKVMIFYVALLPAFIDLRHVTAASYAELVAATLLVLAAVFGAYVLAAVQARRLFAGVRARRILNRATGGLMAGAAVVIAVE